MVLATPFSLILGYSDDSYRVLTCLAAQIEFLVGTGLPCYSVSRTVKELRPRSLDVNRRLRKLGMVVSLEGAR